jgi:hypothetical protein
VQARRPSLHAVRGSSRAIPASAGGGSDGLGVEFQSPHSRFAGWGTGTRNVTIGLESPADSWARERLLDDAFGDARFDKTVERLREGRLPAEGLAFVAKDPRGLIGTLRLWHAGRQTPGTRRFCSSAMQPIMNPLAFPASIRLGFLFPGPSTKRVFSGSNSKRALETFLRSCSKEPLAVVFQFESGQSVGIPL